MLPALWRGGTMQITKLPCSSYIQGTSCWPMQRVCLRLSNARPTWQCPATPGSHDSSRMEGSIRCTLTWTAITWCRLRVLHKISCTWCTWWFSTQGCNVLFHIFAHGLSHWHGLSKWQINGCKAHKRKLCLFELCRSTLVKFVPVFDWSIHLYLGSKWCLSSRLSKGGSWSNSNLSTVLSTHLCMCVLAVFSSSFPHARWFEKLNQPKVDCLRARSRTRGPHFASQEASTKTRQWQSTRVTCSWLI